MSDPFVSERLTYRAPEPSDDKFFEVLGKDVPGYLNSNYSLGVPQSKKRCEEYQKHVTENTLLGVLFCITKITQSPEGVTTKELIPVGCIHMSALKPTQAHHRVTTIGVDVVPEYQGKGYGSEAIMWATGWAFEMANLNKVKIGAFGYNTGARRLYERLGFTLEGVLREDVFFRGKFHDCYEFGMLRREWDALQQQKAVIES